MGGNALKNCVTRRYEAEEYDVLSSEIAHKLFNAGIVCTRIPSYFTKESHGDLDLLVKSETLPHNWVEKIVDKFAPAEYVKNGDDLSFEYKQLQVDLIVTPEENWISSFQYLAFNDLGNLIGRVAHSMGLKLGHDGLTYKYYTNETQVFREITLLKDWKDILPVLGYSYERWEQGFETLDNIFEFVVSSPFFSKDIYLPENRNHAARVRDAKRKTYNAFLQYIENYQETEWQSIHAYKPNPQGKDICLGYLFAHIEGFKEQYDQAKADAEKQQEYKRRFNGALVSEWTGLKEKELGKFMQWLKEWVDQERFKEDIVTLNPVCVERLVKYYFEKYQKEQ